jgi:hypothetical protein
LFWAAAQSLAHAVVFALLATLLLRATHVSEMRTWLLLVIFGAATELLQLFTGRQASAGDFVNDLLGSSAAVLAHVGIRRRARTQVLMAAACTMVAIAPFAWSIAAYTQRALRFPVLFRYDTPLDLYFLERSGTRSRSVLPSICADTRPSALRIRLSADRYAGILLLEPITQWRSMLAMEIYLSNPGPADLTLTVRVHDRLHDWTYADRYNQEYVLPAGARRVIRVSSRELLQGPTNGRHLNLSQIAGIAIFRASTGVPTDICLESIALATRPAEQAPQTGDTGERISSSRQVAYPARGIKRKD